MIGGRPRPGLESPGNQESVGRQASWADNGRTISAKASNDKSLRMALLLKCA